jgi:hypothetical protein
VSANLGLVDAGSRGETVGALPAAGGAVVGELELAGVVTVFPLALLSLACGPSPVSVVHGRDSERAARACRGPRLFPGRPSVEVKFI